MQFIRPPVSTLCHRAGGIRRLAAAVRGRQGHAVTLPNSRIMVHQPSGGFQGQATDILLPRRKIQNIKRRLNEI